MLPEPEQGTADPDETSRWLSPCRLVHPQPGDVVLAGLQGLGQGAEQAFPVPCENQEARHVVADGAGWDDAFQAMRFPLFQIEDRGMELSQQRREAFQDRPAPAGVGGVSAATQASAITAAAPTHHQ